jgi:3-oxoacyl-[acyl-carrier protein] reductase
VLVVNTGSPPRGSFEELDDAAWYDGFQLVLLAAVRAVRAAVPALAASGGGRIILLGSSSTREPIPGLTTSNAYRPGLAGLVASLAGELAPEGISINLISPGRIDTPHARRSDERRAQARGSDLESVREGYCQRIPLGRYGRPEEVGALVAELAAPSAGYLTGARLLVDGGLVPALP